MNIRKCTVVIIKRGAEFLVGRIPYSSEPDSRIVFVDDTELMEEVEDEPEGR